MSLQDDQAPLDREVWDRIFEQVPRGAVRICLTLEQVVSGEQTTYRHTLEATLADGKIQPLTPSDELFAATRALCNLLTQRGAAFATARYESFELPDGNWKTTQRYSYSD